MNFDFITLIGSIAACCTTIAFLPQVIFVWRTQKVDELSLGTFALLEFGTLMWLAYGLLRRDFVIIGANLVTAFLVGYILYKKILSLRKK